MGCDDIAFQRLFSKGCKLDVVEMEFAVGGDVLVLLCVEDGAVLDIDAMHHAFGAYGLDTGLGSVAHNVGDVDVCKYRRKLGALVFLARSPYMVVKIVALEDDGLILDVGHVDVGDVDIFGYSATPYAALEAQSGIGSGKSIVMNEDVLHASAKLRANDEAAVRMINDVVLYVDVLTGTVFCSFFPGASFHTYTVVAGINGVVDNENILAIANIYGVAVLRIPWTDDLDIVDNDIVAALGHKVKLGSVAQCNALHEYIFTVGEPHKMRAHLLLGIVTIGHIGKMLQVEWEPQVAFLCDSSAHSFVLVPFGVAYFASLYGSPVFSVAINDALASNGNILPFGGGNARFGLGVCLSVLYGDKVCLVGRKYNECVAFKMKVNVIFQ